MSIYHGIRAARKALNKKQDTPLRIPAVTGDGNGTLETGTDNLIYCVTATDGVVQAWAYNCPHVYGLPVWVSKSERRPGALEVVGIRDIGSQNASRQSEVGKHGTSHRWLGTEGGGYDPVFIELRQFMPFGLWAGNNADYAFSVYVGRGVIWTGEQYVEVKPAELDLSGGLPMATGGDRYARYTLIYVASKDNGTDAEVRVLYGTVKLATSFTIEDVPTPPSDSLLVIGAVRLYSDQVMIQDGRAGTDVIDLRFPYRSLVDANDLGAGLISTERFSAYADLVDESKIGPGAAQVAAGTHGHAFDDLTDVDMTGAANGNVPVFDASTSTWKAGSLRRGAPERETFAVSTPATAPHYDLLAAAESGGLAVYYNGVRVLDADFTVDVDGYGFTLAFDVLAGDYIIAEYFAPLPPVALFPLTRPYTSDKQDGIFGYLATMGGTRSWINPGLGDAWSPKYYTASQSSTWSNIPEACTNGLYLGDDASHTGNDVNAWWKADFGAGHTLTPDYFGILGRSPSGHQPRNFKIQGSNDDAAWDDLITITGAGPNPGTWYSAAITGAGAYRYIRVYQTGANSDGAWYLVMGELEFWGTLS